MELLEKIRFNRITNAYYKEYKKGDSYKVTDRKWHGYVWCSYGTCTFKQGSNEFTIDDYHMLLIPKHADYEVVVNSNCCLTVLDFELDSKHFMDIQMYPMEENKTFYNNYKKVERLYENDSGTAELMKLSILYDLTAFINRSELGDNKYQLLKKAEKFMVDNLTDAELNMPRLAKECGISEAYFRRLFKEKYAVSPYEYVENLRIKKAKELLATNMSVQKIAEECGYGSIYAFSRAFKNNVGISPRQYKVKYAIITE